MDKEFVIIFVGYVRGVVRILVGFVVGVLIVGFVVEFLLKVGGGGGGFCSEADLVRRDPTMVFPGVRRRPLSSDCGGGGGGGVDSICRGCEEAMMAACAAVWIQKGQ